MQLSKLSISNFRSVNNLSIECSSFITLLGPNNHGKSNILSALEFALSTSSKPTEDDFFAYRPPESNTLWVELTFVELTDQEKTTFKRYLLMDNSIRIRKTAKLENGNINVLYNGWLEQPHEDWLRTENISNYTTRDKINDTPLKDLVPATGRITKEHVESAQQSYIQEHIDNLSLSIELENSPLLGQRNVAGGVLPEFYLIPAVRDLTDEIKIRTTTTFGRLMNRAVHEMAERDQRFIDAREQLRKVLSSLNDRQSHDKNPNEIAVLEENIEKELSSWGVKVNIEVTPPEMEKLFELGADIHLDDGVRTTADRKGHGLQRAVMFALLRSWASALRYDRTEIDDKKITPRKQSSSVIFAMEEPELFLHPHAQRTLSKSLRDIAETPDHQVLICTHSTYFVNLERYKEVAIISKETPTAGSEVRQCTTELFTGDKIEERKKRFRMAEWINPYRGELFFAKRVIFVEGETEKVILPYIANKLGSFNPDVSIIDCGSKHNLPFYIAIAKAFKIPYIVIHDVDPIEDPIPKEWSEDKVKQKKRTFALNQELQQLAEQPLGKIKQFSPDFETVSGVSKTQGDKMGKALAALEHFEAKSHNDIPERLKSIVETAYNLSV